MVFTVRYELNSYISRRSVTRAPLCGHRLQARASLRSVDFLSHVTGKQAMAWALSGLQTFRAGRGDRVTGVVWKFRPQTVPEARFLFAHLITSRQNRRRRGPIPFSPGGGSLPQDLLTNFRLCYLEYSGQNPFWNNFSFFWINIWHISLFLFFFQNPKVRGHAWLAPNLPESTREETIWVLRYRWEDNIKIDHK
jgi:hypothetical protein